MSRFLAAINLIFLLAASVCAQPAPSYAKHVRPFLVKYCLECHNAKTMEGNLSLESYAALKAGSDQGPVFIAGQPDKSRIVLVCEGKLKPTMPPKKAKYRPSKSEIGLLRNWIAAGATDDSTRVKVVLPSVKSLVPSLPPVTAIAYVPASQQLFMARDKTLTVAALATNPPPPKKVHLPAAISALATLPKSGSLFAAVSRPGESGDAMVYHLPDKLGSFFRLGHTDLILDLACSPTAPIYATASYDTQIRLVDAPTGKTLHLLKEHSDAVYGLAFSPDGARLASVSADRALKVFAVADGSLLYTLGEATDWLYAVAWSPDGKYLVSGGVDKSIRVYEPTAKGAKLRQSVFAHEGPVQKLVFASDSKTLYSVGEDRVVKAWDVERMVERKVYAPQPETVLCLALREAAQQIIVGRYDGIVQLIDMKTGKVAAEFGRVDADDQSSSLASPTHYVSLAAAPSIKSLIPAAIPRGKTSRITLTGQALDQVDHVTVESSIAAKIIQRTMTTLLLEITPPASLRADVQKLTLHGKNGSATTTLIVDAYPVVAEADAGNSPATGQKITLPTSISGTLDRAGDVDFFRFEAKKDQPLGIHVLTKEIGSKLDPVLVLTDLASRTLAESSDGHLGYTFASTGTYVLGVRDRDFRGGADFKYRLHLGQIPVISSHFPLGMQQGKNGLVQVTGVFLDQTNIKVQVPAEAVLGSKISVPVSSKFGPPLGQAQLVVGTYSDIFSPSTIPIPGTANGQIAKEGQQDLWTFSAKKDQKLIVEVNARRLGSRLDSILEILDKNRQPIPRAVLRSQAKTYVTFRDHDSNSSAIRLEAWSEFATNDFLYVGNELMKIESLPTHPDANCIFFSTAGQRLAYLDTTPMHHSNNTPMYKVSLHPPGKVFPPNGYPVFTLYYRNDDGGPGYGRDSRLFFDPPADGDYFVRLTDARGLGGDRFGYRLTVRRPQPSFTIAVTPTNPTLAKGGAVSLKITAERLDGYDGPIDVRFESLPPGFHAPATRIEAGTYATAVALYANPDATMPISSIKAIGEATIEGKKQHKEVMVGTPKLIEAGDLVTTTQEAEVSIKPGQQTKLTVRIERRNGFVGRVPLDVRGLPHGVHVLDIGLNGILINENEAARTMVLYAEPWVQAAEHPFVVLARREGKNTEHAAKSVLLKVQ